ncbi:MAG: MerC domain-containing protein [Gammaproteobacteria bacterium]
MEAQRVEVSRFDKAAITLSAVCLLHCLALPVALLLAPTLGPAVLGTESPVHWLLLALATPVSAYALWHGYSEHGRRMAPLLGAIGIVIMFTAVSHVFDRALETLLTVAGVTVLLVAHAMNLRHGHARPAR